MTEATAALLTGILLITGALTALSTTASADNNDNDGIKTAENLGGEGTYTGYLELGEDMEDYYKLLLTAGQVVAFKCTNNGPAETTFYFYGPDQVEVGSGVPCVPGKSATFTWATNNTPTLCQVSAIYGTQADLEKPGLYQTATYSITVTITKQDDAGSGGDAGDGLGTATPVEVNTNYTGMLKNLDNEDFYRFEGKKGYDVEVNFNMTSGVRDMGATLYDSNGSYHSEASFIRVGEPYDFGMDFDVNGTYYLRFYTDWGKCNYSFWLSQPEDVEYPEGEVRSPEDGSVINASTVDLWGVASDNEEVVSVQVTLDGINWTNASGTTEWRLDDVPLKPGGNSILVMIIDRARNKQYIVITVTSDPQGGGDDVPPIVNILSPGNGTTVNSSTVTVAGTAWDDGEVRKVEVSLDGANWRNATGTVNWTFTGLPLVAGGNTIHARATDNGGKTGSNWIMVAFTNGTSGSDRSPPWINFTSPRKGARVLQAELSVTGTAGDDAGLARVEVRLDGGSWKSATGTKSWTCDLEGLTRGNHSIEARATDTSGLTASSSVSFSCDPEAQLPGGIITSHPNNTAVSTSTITVSGRTIGVPNVTSIELEVNGEKVDVEVKADGNWTANITLKKGKNTIETLVHDTSGNTFSRNFVIKYNKPGEGPKPPIPGLETLSLALAMLLGLLLARRRKS